MQFTSACLTLNNWTQDEYNALVALVPSFLSYAVIGKEVGEQGTPHLQCYVEFTNRPSIGKVKSVLGNRYHIERRHGTQAQAINYIIANPDKPNPVWAEFGQKKHQGLRTDLHRTVELALTSGMRTVAAISSNSQQIRHAEMALTYLEPVRNSKPEVIWIHGPSGIGKSRLALQTVEDRFEGDWYRKGVSSGKWFPGYDGHKALWLDDMTEDFFGEGVDTYRFLIELTDRYPCWVQYKGGQRQMLSELIIITSVDRPSYMFPDYTGELKRRIDQVIDLTTCKLQEVGGNTSTPTSHR